MDGSAHWKQIYRMQRPDQVNWFQAEARLSRRIELTRARRPDRGALAGEARRWANEQVK